VEVQKKDPDREIILEISWDLIKQNATEFDVSCVLFDENRNLRETVSIFQPQNSNETGFGAVNHSGSTKNSTEGDGFELINLNLTKLDPTIRALMFAVTCPSGDFSQVDSANICLRKGERQLVSFCLGCQGKHTALLLCALFKGVNNKWFFMNVGDATVGKHIKDMEPLMNKHLKQLILNKSGDIFFLNKGDVMDLPEIDDLIIGLNWKLGGIMEVHSSIMLFDNVGRNNDDVYFVNRGSLDRSVNHLDVVPDSGFQEQYSLSFGKVLKSVNVIVGAITIYSMDDSMVTSTDPNVISDVSCRFINKETGKDICRYEIHNFGRNNSHIAFKISRKSPFEPNRWRLTAIEFPTSGKSVVDVIPDVQEYYVERWDDMFRWTTTEITIVSATGLRAVKGTKGLSNPHARVIVDRDQKLFMNTPTEKKTTNPTWDFGYQTDAIPLCEIEIWHKAIFSSTFLGKVDVDIQSLPLESENDVFVNLNGRGKNATEDSKITGSLHLKVTKKK